MDTFIQLLRFKCKAFICPGDNVGKLAVADVGDVYHKTHDGNDDIENTKTEDRFHYLSSE
jgi:hypothetical protein